MKKYEQPAIELIKFSMMDVLVASTNGTFDTNTQEGNFEELFGGL